MTVSNHFYTIRVGEGLRERGKGEKVAITCRNSIDQNEISRIVDLLNTDISDFYAFQK